MSSGFGFGSLVVARRIVQADAFFFLAREPRLRLRARRVRLDTQRLISGEQLQQERQMRAITVRDALAQRAFGVRGNHGVEAPACDLGRCGTMGAEPELSLRRLAGHLGATQLRKQRVRPPRVVPQSPL